MLVGCSVGWLVGWLVWYGIGPSLTENVGLVGWLVGWYGMLLGLA